MSGAVSAIDAEYIGGEIITLIDITFDLVQENDRISAGEKEKILTMLHVLRERGITLQDLANKPYGVANDIQALAVSK